MKLVKILTALILIFSLLMPAVALASETESPVLSSGKSKSEVLEENIEIQQETISSDNKQDDAKLEPIVTEEDPIKDDEIIIENEQAKPDQENTESTIEEGSKEIENQPSEKDEIKQPESSLPTEKDMQVIEKEKSIKKDGELAPSSPKQNQTMMRSMSITTASVEASTSKLGHLKNDKVRIYTDYKKVETYKLAGTEHTHQVYYIKKQAKIADTLFYMISYNPSSSTGVVGWVKASDLSIKVHSGVDKLQKTFYINGTGNAYTKAWGGRKDISYEGLSKIKKQKFIVNLTELVGDEVWYRGTVAGKIAWISESALTYGAEDKTSILGHLKSEGIHIYHNYYETNKYEVAGAEHTHEVYYIKKQAEYNGIIYYLISRNPSTTIGILGWVKASDLSTKAHVGIDKIQKTFYINGTGNAYDKAWGGKRNISYSGLSKVKGQKFIVNLTEKVGNVVWHRGIIEGKTAWINEADLALGFESKTSLLGHIKSNSVLIYEDYKNEKNYQTAGTEYTNEVYYIKKQVEYEDGLYYLISRNPSSTTGVVGWVKASNLAVQEHVGIDKIQKTFYLKGTGSAYTKAWGGKKNFSQQDLSKLKNNKFIVNLTEKVGNNVWHRGTIDGKTAWIHEDYVALGLESATSQLGHLNSTTVQIYKDYANSLEYIQAGTGYTDEVYYIKKQAEYNNSFYYLISRSPSSTTGVVGWVKESDLSIKTHITVDKLAKTFYIKGSGNAYNKTWGGSKNVVIKDMSGLKGADFAINLTERVGNDIWHRGVVGGKTVWLHEEELIKVETKYTQYPLTFNEALAKQMKVLQQTDKYANNKAYVASSKIKATIKSDKTNLRTAAKLASSYVALSVNKGTAVTILEEVTGDLSSGSTRWYKIKYANRTLYAHSSVVNTTTTEKTNVVNAGNTGHIFGTLAAGTNVTLKKKGTSWDEISYGAWRNPTQTDVANYLEPSDNDKFQHLLLTSSAGVTATELNKILVGKGSLAGQGQAFINGGKQYSVNEVYLISHALLETGQGTSSLANGVEVGKNALGTPVLVTVANRSSLKSIQKTYNMFGIGAVDGNALAAGAVKAYNSGWFTPEAAIVGGAQFVGTNYLDKGQDTLYKMRWNPASPATHQYASDIGWATKQTVKMNSLYKMLDSYTLTFDIPKYK